MGAFTYYEIKYAEFKTKKGERRLPKSQMEFSIGIDRCVSNRGMYKK